MVVSGDGPREHVLGVVTADDSASPVALDSFPRRVPWAQAVRKAALKDARRNGATALTGAKACKCSNDSCNNTRLIPVSNPAHINSTYKHPPAQGEIGRIGASSSSRAGAADAGAPGATAVARRTEMRDDNIHSTTYGHREICGKFDDRDRGVRFDSRIGTVGDLRSGVSSVRDSGGSYTHLRAHGPAS